MRSTGNGRSRFLLSLQIWKNLNLRGRLISAMFGVLNSSGKNKKLPGNFNSRGSNRFFLASWAFLVDICTTGKVVE